MMGVERANKRDPETRAKVQSSQYIPRNPPGWGASQSQQSESGNQLKFQDTQGPRLYLDA